MDGGASVLGASRSVEHGGTAIVLALSPDRRGASWTSYCGPSTPSTTTRIFCFVYPRRPAGRKWCEIVARPTVPERGRPSSRRRASHCEGGLVAHRRKSTDPGSRGTAVVSRDRAPATPQNRAEAPRNRCLNRQPEPTPTEPAACPDLPLTNKSQPRATCLRESWDGRERTDQPALTLVGCRWSQGLGCPENPRVGGSTPSQATSHLRSNLARCNHISQALHGFRRSGTATRGAESQRPCRTFFARRSSWRGSCLCLNSAPASCACRLRTQSPRLTGGLWSL